MCGFCMAAEVADLCDGKHRKLEGEIPASELVAPPEDPSTIGLTIPGDVSTTEVITVGGTREETLDFSGDTDWFRLDLVDQQVRINLTGVDHDTGNALGALSDPLLNVFLADGTLVVSNDDGGPGLNSELTLSATGTLSVYVEANSFNNNFAGDYRLEVVDITPSGPPPTDGIPADITTTEVITVGGTRDGTLEVVGDADWYRIDLNDGDAIQIDLFGLDHDTGNGLADLEDPLVRVYDASGTLLASNDDIQNGVQRDSRLVFQANGTGTYFIEADSYDDNYAGDYRLQVAAATPPPPASPLDSIQSNRILNTNDPVLVYFGQAGDVYTEPDGTTYTATGINAYEQGQLESIFDGVEEFLDVDFQITTDRNTADLEWATSVLPSVSGGTLLGFFYFPSSNGNGGFGILNNNQSAFPNWNTTPGGTLDTGGFMYGVSIHELGHGLGLAHPHDTGAGTDRMQGVNSSSDLGAFLLNQSPFTAMSYNEGWTENPAGVASSVAATGHGATFGALDIAALQNMYGANTTHATGDDTYDLFDTQATGSGAGYYTTWDTNGIDTFRYSGTRDAIIDLRPATLAYDAGGGGFMSYVDGIRAGRTIANGVTIENATGGSGDDSLTGNDADNTLTGNGGNDTLIGGAGADLLIGGTGSDQMTGGTGADTFELDFGDGFDTILDFELGTDVIDLLGLGLGFGDLTITDVSGNAQVQYDFTTSGQVTLTGIAVGDLGAANFLLDVVSGPITGTPNADSLDGTSGDDEILGLGSGDTLNGLAGADSISGGEGNDSLFGGSEGDSLFGDAGDDALDGGLGDDTVEGGTGNDTIVYTSGADSIDGGGDIDTLDVTGLGASASFDLTGTGLGITLGNVENVLLSDFGNTLTGDGAGNTITAGTGADSISTQGGNDSILGDAGNDTLDGGADDDAIDGGIGVDVITGGTGNDTLTGGGDADTFAFAFGDGLDTITDFVIGTDLIDLRGLGIGFTDLTIADNGGNALVTYDATTTTGAVTLNSIAAASLTESDFLLDAAGPPPLPQIVGTSGNDNLAGQSNVAEELLGLGGNDVLNGRGGGDIVRGGAGDDRIYLQGDTDVAIEEAGEGYDRVFAYHDYVLPTHIEAGVLLGTATSLTGNAVANWLTGSNLNNQISGLDGNDRLQGLDGDDTLDGGTGFDVLEGGTGADVFAFGALAGVDTVLDFEIGVDRVDVSALGLAFADLIVAQSGSRTVIAWDDPGNPGTQGGVYLNGVTVTDIGLDDVITGFGNSQPAITGTANADTLIGSQIDDELIGLGGNDRLDGRLGADTMTGGTGDDEYYVDNAGDLIVEQAGEGTERVYASVTYTLSANVENAAVTGTASIGLTGSADANWLSGNSGNNALNGAGGNDRLQGELGDDTLTGGTGNDALFGGTGADVFVFNQGDGTDSLLDYEDGTDRLDVSSLGITFGDLRIVDSGANVIVFYDETNPADRGLVVITGHSASDMDASDFIFT